MQIPPPLNALLDAAGFDGLAIDKTPAGYSVSILSGDNWSPLVTRGTVCEALVAALGAPFSMQLATTLAPCPVSLPPCPVPLP